MSGGARIGPFINDSWTGVAEEKYLQILWEANVAARKHYASASEISNRKLPRQVISHMKATSQHSYNQLLKNTTLSREKGNIMLGSSSDHNF